MPDEKQIIQELIANWKIIERNTADAMPDDSSEDRYIATADEFNKSLGIPPRKA